MRTVKTLYKAFGASLEMPRPESNGKARVYGVFGFIAFALIFIPSSILVGYITYLLSNLLMFFGERSYALISLVHIISAFTMIFILPVMFTLWQRMRRTWVYCGAEHPAPRMSNAWSLPVLEMRFIAAPFIKTSSGKRK